MVTIIIVHIKYNFYDKIVNINIYNNIKTYNYNFIVNQILINVMY